MARSRRRPQIQFQAPFLVGALSAVTLSAGCRGFVEDGPGTNGTGGSDGSDAWDGAGGSNNPPYVLQHCPEVTPRPGESCEGYTVGLSCGVLSSCHPEGQVTCGSSGTWYDSNVSCNPPPIILDTCPPVTPEPGESCYGYQAELVCAVANCEGDPGIHCGTDGLWKFEYQFCNPPFIEMGGAGGMGPSEADDGGVP